MVFCGLPVFTAWAGRKFSQAWTQILPRLAASFRLTSDDAKVRIFHQFYKFSGQKQLFFHPISLPILQTFPIVIGSENVTSWRVTFSTKILVKSHKSQSHKLVRENKSIFILCFAYLFVPLHTLNVYKSQLLLDISAWNDLLHPTKSTFSRAATHPRAVTLSYADLYGKSTSLSLRQILPWG